MEQIVIPGSAKEIFELVTTHGVPLEIIERFFEENPALTYEKDEYEKLFNAHREKSKAGRTKKVFK